MQLRFSSEQACFFVQGGNSAASAGEALVLSTPFTGKAEANIAAGDKVYGVHEGGWPMRPAPYDLQANLSGEIVARRDGTGFIAAVGSYYIRWVTGDGVNSWKAFKDLDPTGTASFNSEYATKHVDIGWGDYAASVLTNAKNIYVYRFFGDSLEVVDSIALNGEQSAGVRFQKKAGSNTFFVLDKTAVYSIWRDGTTWKKQAYPLRDESYMSGRWLL